MVLLNMAPRTVFICPLLGNDALTGPCNLNGTVICAGSNSRAQCLCSSITYLLAGACNSCETAPKLSWDGFAANTGCTGLPQEFPPPLPTGKASIPGWVLAMISATPTPTSFNSAAASSFASSLLDGTPPTSSPDVATTSSSPSIPPTQSKGPTATPSQTTTVPTSAPSAIAPKSASSSTHISDTSRPRSQSPTRSVIPSDSTSIFGSGFSSVPTTQGSNQPAAFVHRNTLSAGPIVGIVLAIISFIVLAVLLLWCRRHRRREQGTGSTIVNAFPIASASADVLAYSANTASKADAQNISAAARRSFLQNELRAVQEKILHIDDQDSEQYTISQTHATATAAGRIMRVFNSTRTTARSGVPASDRDVVSHLRQRDEMLTARIRELEAQLESPWAHGLSNTPPPGYWGDDSSESRI